ncbi:MULTISPECIES: 30S ribosomal protein S4 [Hymenobacter]|jgi:small subunit ribosomal protein S4|uniref:Small ribosomal subunit protein uS4 n=5 Tax=Hymenobacter TaxID=89966 RepID=A0A9X1VGM6_9BACT|nr:MULTISPECIES: 30S ribosomal protein S4 [Hymenobacter]MBF9219549.1 30S ribosomal protein S4 [Hymenobacter ruricola]MBH8559472.1 30S ribosomal protein S4 [Hymenobacter negativus]MBO2012397.1 30S ribosomal protein S4 [Hymenobacter negativus]MCI1188834.1 30S ribosomal protein S4 [Hymenobacter cyanobacteriorum]MDO7844994.1 30S ribosomal protein S4 [Hymenobacter sp. M29]
MARYTGPTSKIARRFNEPIFGPSKALNKKAYPPGQHGRGRRKKQSEYAVQLMEKQKVKYMYGMLEKQFENLFHKAAALPGITGDNLLALLEARLDNAVYRLGIASTRRAARQLVGHKHITVNGEVVNIPSYHLRPGDIVAVREKSKSLEAITTSLSVRNSRQFSWLEWDGKELAGKFLNAPARELIPEKITEQLIVELYSK